MASTSRLDDGNCVDVLSCGILTAVSRALWRLHESILHYELNGFDRRAAHPPTHHDLEGDQR